MNELAKDNLSDWGFSVQFDTRELDWHEVNSRWCRLSRYWNEAEDRGIEREGFAQEEGSRRLNPTNRNEHNPSSEGEYRNSVVQATESAFCVHIAVRRNPGR